MCYFLFLRHDSSSHSSLPQAVLVPTRLQDKGVFWAYTDSHTFYFLEHWLCVFWHLSATGPMAHITALWGRKHGFGISYILNKSGRILGGCKWSNGMKEWSSLLCKPVTISYFWERQNLPVQNLNGITMFCCFPIRRVKPNGTFVF